MPFESTPNVSAREIRVGDEVRLHRNYVRIVSIRPSPTPRSLIDRLNLALDSAEAGDFDRVVSILMGLEDDARRVAMGCAGKIRLIAGSGFRDADPDELLPVR